MKDQKIYILIPLVLFFFSFKFIYSTHIVGGDFKVSMISHGSNSSMYDIQLRLYRDDVNGAVNMPVSVTIGIYQVGTNNLQLYLCWTKCWTKKKPPYLFRRLIKYPL